MDWAGESLKVPRGDSNLRSRLKMNPPSSKLLPPSSGLCLHMDCTCLTQCESPKGTDPLPSDFYVFIVYIPGNTVGSPRLVKQKSNQIKVCTVLGRLPLCSSTTNPKFPGRSLSDSVYQWSACRSLPFLNVALHGLLLLVNWIMHPKSLWPGRWTHFDFPPSVALSWLFLV